MGCHHMLSPVATCHQTCIRDMSESSQEHISRQPTGITCFAQLIFYKIVSHASTRINTVKKSNGKGQTKVQFKSGLSPHRPSQRKYSVLKEPCTSLVARGETWPRSLRSLLAMPPRKEKHALLPLARMCAPRAKMVPRPQGIFYGKLLYGRE